MSKNKQPKACPTHKNWEYWTECPECAKLEHANPADMPSRPVDPGNFDPEYFWQQHRRTFTGVNGGEYIDKEDFEKALDQASVYALDRSAAPSKEGASQDPIPEEIKDWIDDNAESDTDNDTTLWRNGAIAMYYKLQESPDLIETTDERTQRKLAEWYLKQLRECQSQLSSMKAERDEANQLIRDIGKLLGEDGLGFDGLSWTLEDFENAIKATLTTIEKDRDLYKAEVQTWKDECNTLSVLLEGKNLENAQYSEIRKEMEERHAYLRAEENKAIDELDALAAGSIERTAKWVLIRDLCDRRNELWRWINKYKKEEQK